MDETIEAIARRAVAARIFPGCVVRAERPGRPAFHAAFGATQYDDPATRPLAPADIFDIASLTKVFTASAALALLDAGQIRLDAEVGAYLPGLAAHGVTVRHLLTHTSGLDLRLSVLRQGGPSGIMAAVRATAPRHMPGAFVAYTNINSLLLGEVVAVAAGMPLDAALGELILAPLGLAETGYNPAADLRPRIVPTEWDDDWRGGLVHGVVHDESACALGGVAGHAGLFSTAADLARFLRFWLQGGAWGGRQILREATVAAALRDYTFGLPTATGAPARSGLGWMLDRGSFMGLAPAGSFGHTGFTGPAIVGVPAAELAFVILSNRTYPRRTPPPYRHHAVTAAILEQHL
jgi:CubicO group peptidase (beta-lactamase class C family)